MSIDYKPNEFISSIPVCILYIFYHKQMFWACALAHKCEFLMAETICISISFVLMCKFSNRAQICLEILVLNIFCLVLIGSDKHLVQTLIVLSQT